MFDTLITSKTRLKLLMKFFLNPEISAHLRGLEEEFQESTNGIRVELNRFEEAGMLSSEQVGQKKVFKVRTDYPLYPEIHNILKKQLGLDQLVERVAKNMGELTHVYLVGPLANGQDKGTIDVLLVGKLNYEYLAGIVKKAESLTGRTINYSTCADGSSLKREQPYLLLWQA